MRILTKVLLAQNLTGLLLTNPLNRIFPCRIVLRMLLLPTPVSSNRTGAGNAHQTQFLKSVFIVWAETVSRHSLKQRKDICDMVEGLIENNTNNAQICRAAFVVIAKMIWQKQINPSSVRILLPLMSSVHGVKAFSTQLFEREKATLPSILFEIFFMAKPDRRIPLANDICKFKEATKQGGKLAISLMEQIQTVVKFTDCDEAAAYFVSKLPNSVKNVFRYVMCSWSRTITSEPNKKVVPFLFTHL